jgi:hypothetical protein
MGGVPNTSCRIFTIKCVGDSNNVADMLEDIANRIRKGMIHKEEDMFYTVDSYGYIKEENRPKKHA